MISKRNITILTVALLALSMLATPAMAAGTQPNFDADAPNGQYEYDVTKSTHNMPWGADSTAALTYEDNDGDRTVLDARINDSDRNPISYTATDVELDDYGATPQSKDDVSTLDASEWSTTAGATVDDVTTAPGVEAVSVSTSGLTSGSSETATFSNFSVTSDENKRYLSIVADVPELQSGAVVDVIVRDANGDEKIATIDASADASADDVIATETGEGFAYQHRLGDLSTIADGDGNFDNIEEIEVNVSDADATVEIAGLNTERLKEYKFGETEVQNSDDEWESESITEINTPGPIEITSLNTLGGGFESATIHSLTVAAEQPAELQPDEDIQATFEKDTNNTYPGFYGTAEVYIRDGLTSAYDVRYSNVKLTFTQELPTSRYVSASYAEDVGDSDFEDIGDSTWSSFTGSLATNGETYTIDNTVQAGDESVRRYNLKLSQGEFNQMQSSGTPGSGFWGEQSSDSGPIGGLINWVMAGITTILGAVGIKSRMGS